MLERAAVRSTSSQDRLLAGSLLILLYGRCRFGDGQRATSFLIDLAPGAKEGFVEFAVRHFKTAVGVKKKRMLLPVVVPIFSLSGESWFSAWLDARADLGLSREGTLVVPLLPCFDSTGRPTSAALSSSEGGAVLRTFIGGLGEGSQRVTSHSLKTTLLSWTAKYGLQLPVRRILGYHLDPAAATTETYARDAMAAPLRELVVVLQKVQCGAFRPDETRSGMFCATGPVPSAGCQGFVDTSLSRDAELTDDSDTDAASKGSSRSADSDSEPETLDDDAPLFQLVPARLRPQLLCAAPGRKLFRNKYSGVFHIQADGERLVCGRCVTDNFAEFASTSAKSVKCKVCFVESRDIVEARMSA